MAITEKYASSAGSGDKNGTSEAHAWDWATMLTDANAGDRVNFKGNHTLTGNATFTNPGTVTSPLILRGYSSSITDGYQGRTNGNGPLITTNLPVITCGGYSLTQPSLSIVESLSITGTRNGGVLLGGTYSVVTRCLLVNSGTGASGTATQLSTNGLAFDCDLKLTGGSGGLGAIYAASASIIVSCRADGGNGAGIILGAAGAGAILCTAYSSGTDAILINTTSSGVFAVACTCVSSTSDGIHIITAAARTVALIGNLIADNGVYGIYAVDAAAPIFSAFNRLDRNGTAATSGATDWLSATGYGNNTTGATQANEFPGAGSDDYRLGATSPARSNGIPPYLDIGALQRIKDYPDAGNVTEDDTTDGTTGTYHEATTAEVQAGVMFGAASALEGTYEAADYPSEDDVRDGVTFNTGANEGNMTLPAVADVKDGVTYGTAGTEYEGTYVGGGGGAINLDKMGAL